VIESGLEEHDRVALNPRKFVAEVALPELPPEQQQRAVPQAAPKEIAAVESEAGSATESPSAVKTSTAGG